MAISPSRCWLASVFWAALAAAATVRAADAESIAAAVAPAAAATATPASTSTAEPDAAADSTAHPEEGASAETAAAPPTEAAATPSGTRVPWQGDPIPVALKVNAERRIDFPEPIADLDVPKAVEGRSRIVLTPAGRLHWTAREPFPPARVLATSVGGTLYQLDVGARADGAAPERLTLTDPLLEAAAVARAHAPDRRATLERAASRLLPDFLKGETGGGRRAGGPSYVALARFVLAHFTGPARLIPQLDATRVAVRPIDPRAWLRVQSASLTIQPLRQWQAGELYVTALGVANRGPYAVPFDPRALRGALLFAAALHPTLGPSGSGHNGTIWTVVTRQPFNQALDDGPARTLAR